MERFGTSDTDPTRMNEVRSGSGTILSGEPVIGGHSTGSVSCWYARILLRHCCDPLPEKCLRVLDSPPIPVLRKSSKQQFYTDSIGATPPISLCGRCRL